MIFAYCNQKGGVGKSTTVYHHARAAILAGKKVLVIDADPLGNITSVLTDDVAESDAGLADALSSRSGLVLADVIVDGLWPGLSIVPTVGDSLEGVRNELVVSSEPGRESRMREQLVDIRSQYDLVLIDCAPAIDPLTITALTAADAVVVVSQSKLWSVNGLSKLLNNVQLVQKYYNPGLEVAGLILNAHEPRTLAGGYWADELTAAVEATQLSILTPPVPKRQAIADATETSTGLDEGDVASRELAEIYSSHVHQLMNRAYEMTNHNARRPSRRAGTSPVMPVRGHIDESRKPEVQAPPTHTAPRQVKEENPRKRVGYYADVEDEERIRAAFIAARNAGRGYRSLSEFQLAGILALTARMEQELNEGLPFTGS